jgi:hypothetical protein
MTRTSEEIPQPGKLSDVPGWFFPVDQLLFDWFLTRQKEAGEPGDLLEVGAYLGKSAIFSGSYLREGEKFTVCDLFDSPAEDQSNSREMAKSYSTLTRRSFDANYQAFHDEPPVVVQGLSSLVADHVGAGTCRFVHVDASHLYEHVHADIQCARERLLPHGIVALDDFRAEHCPGVAAATWQAVTTGGLHAICITGTKFYGTWGDPDEVREELLRWLKGREDLWHEVQSVAGEPLIRINGKKAVPPPHPVSRYAGKAASAASAATAPAADRPPTKSRWKRSAARRVAGRVLRATGARALLPRRGN